MHVHKRDDCGFNLDADEVCGVSPSNFKNYKKVTFPRVVPINIHVAITTTFS